jgi:ABC-2 type transport system ATP-binding protein
VNKAFSFNNVVKRFKDFQLGPLNLDLEAGTVLGYVGPNGAGKTTTMQCLIGLLKAESGNMYVFGRENDPNNPEWKLDVGFVGDVHVFYENWTAEQNLRFVSKFYPMWDAQHAEELTRRFNLPIKRKAKDLSTGNRVKLSLVKAMAYRPRLLVLDEPTAGLDPVVRAELLDTLFEVMESEDSAIFYSTHILNDISRLADELAFINDGKLLLKTSKEFLTDKWRKITFRLEPGTQFLLGEFESHRQKGNAHQIISTNFEKRLSEINALKAQNIEVARMTIEEIAVEILRGVNNRAGNTES